MFKSYYILLFCFFLLSDNQSTMDVNPKNVLGTELRSCCTEPMTGFYRDGFCSTGHNDTGVHVVCALVTEDFLTYTKNQGNDLSTPFPQFNFPGLNAGDKWCLCASRWKEAMEAGFAPPIVLESTHERALNFVTLEQLKKYAVPYKEENKRPTKRL